MGTESPGFCLKKQQDCLGEVTLLLFLTMEMVQTVKKDIIYSMRMSSAVRDALKKAAKKTRRTVASLLDKIITDYLEKEGFAVQEEQTLERRKFPRKKITLPGTAYLETGEQIEAFPSVILDMSAGGVLVTYPKGSPVRMASIGELPKFELAFALPHTGEVVRFGCNSCRMLDVGNEIQIGATFRNAADESLQKLKSYLA